MMTTTIQPLDNTSQVAGQSQSGIGLALVRLTIGAMFVWIFFENLGKDLYTPLHYAALIRDYIENASAPAVWRRVGELAASHASNALPLHGHTEISVRGVIVISLVTLSAALCD